MQIYTRDRPSTQFTFSIQCQSRSSSSIAAVDPLYEQKQIVGSLSLLKSVISRRSSRRSTEFLQVVGRRLRCLAAHDVDVGGGEKVLGHLVVVCWRLRTAAAALYGSPFPGRSGSRALQKSSRGPQPDTNTQVAEAQKGDHNHFAQLINKKFQAQNT